MFSFEATTKILHGATCTTCSYQCMVKYVLLHEEKTISTTTTYQYLISITTRKYFAKKIWNGMFSFEETTKILHGGTCTTCSYQYIVKYVLLHEEKTIITTITYHYLISITTRKHFARKILNGMFRFEEM